MNGASWTRVARLYTKADLRAGWRPLSYLMSGRELITQPAFVCALQRSVAARLLLVPDRRRSFPMKGGEVIRQSVAVPFLRVT